MPRTARQSDLFPQLLRAAKEHDKAARTLHEAGRVRRVSVLDSDSTHDETWSYPLDKGGSIVITWSHHEGHEPIGFQDELYAEYSQIVGSADSSSSDDWRSAPGE